MAVVHFSVVIPTYKRLPMLLRVLTSRNGVLDAAVKRALTGGAEGVVHMNSDRCLDV